MTKKQSNPVQKVIEILNPVFPSGDVLVICGTTEFKEKAVKKYGLPEGTVSDKEFAGTFIEIIDDETGRRFGCILIDAMEFTVDEYDILSHEVSHLVDWVIQHHGVDESPRHAETRAYLTGFYFRTIVAELSGVKLNTFRQKHAIKETK